MTSPVGDQARIRAFLAAIRTRLRLKQIAADSVVVAAGIAGLLLALLSAAGGSEPSPGWRSAWWTMSCRWPTSRTG